jgi:hypothetical protein
MPISSILCDRLLGYFIQCLIKCLHKVICLRIIIGGIIPRDVIFCNKPLHLVGFENLGIVRADSTRNAKAIYDMSL